MAAGGFTSLLTGPGGVLFTPSAPPAGYVPTFKGINTGGGLNLSSAVNILGAFKDFLPNNDAGLAAKSVVFTGDPISSALLTAGNFLLGKSGQGQQEKAARLAASFERDKTSTGITAQFYAERLDPSDPASQTFIDAANTALANKDDKQQGELTYQLGKLGSQILIQQAQAGRAVLPDPSELLWAPGAQENADTIARHAATGSLLNVLGGLTREKFGQDIFPLAGVTAATPSAEEVKKAVGNAYDKLGLAFGPASSLSLSSPAAGGAGITSLVSEGQSAGLVPFYGFNFGGGAPQETFNPVIREVKQGESIPIGWTLAILAVAGVTLLIAAKRS